MKKILLIAVLGTAALALSAQEKGDFSVGGVIGVSGGSNSSKISTTVANETSSTNSSSPAATSFTLSPMFNIFVIDNLQLSAGLSYQMGREFSRKDSKQGKESLCWSGKRTGHRQSAGKDVSVWRKKDKQCPPKPQG